MHLPLSSILDLIQFITQHSAAEHTYTVTYSLTQNEIRVQNLEDEDEDEEDERKEKDFKFKIVTTLWSLMPPPLRV